jgi:hypothetical protein
MNRLLNFYLTGSNDREKAIKDLCRKRSDRSNECYKAMVKLAAVVVGLPFFFKLARTAWCAVWSSLLYTWNVARGFQDDTAERPLISGTRLYFHQLVADAKNDFRSNAL